MTAMADILSGQGNNLSGILAQLRALLTPTEQLPGQQSPTNLLLSMPQPLGPQSGAPGQQAARMGTSQGQGASGPAQGGGGSSLVSTLLKNPSLIKSAYSAISNALGGGLSAFGSQAAAGTAAELGSAAAPALAADTAAALTPAVGSGSTAAELGTTADTLASNAAAVDAAGSSAAGSGSAASSAAGTAGSGGSGLLGAAGALAPFAAILASYETTNPVNETAAWWNDMTNRLNSSNPDTANMARLTVANDYLNGGGDMPYTQQQLAQFGITPQFLANLSRPITTPSPDGRGWLGGAGRGARG